MIKLPIFSSKRVYRGSIPIWAWNDSRFLPEVYIEGALILRNFTTRLSANNESISFGSFQLPDALLHSDRLIFQGGIDPIIRGC